MHGYLENYTVSCNNGCMNNCFIFCPATAYTELVADIQSPFRTTISVFTEPALSLFYNARKAKGLLRLPPNCVG